MKKTRPVVHGRNGVIASGHYLATAAGLKMLAKGGNAVDAGVAAGFALAVLKPQQNSMGGECPILIYSPVNKTVTAISGQGTAPRHATPEWFKQHNIDLIPGDGLLGATVPGLFGAYATALLKYGKLTIDEVMAPAIELAESGFPMYEALHKALAGLKDKFLKEWTSSAEVFLPNGRVPEIGEILKQSVLAATLKRLTAEERRFQNEGRETAIRQTIKFFYNGEIAEKLVRFSKNCPVKDATGKAHTGLLEMEDFATYITREEEPLSVEYKQYQVFKCGPWTQGPVFLQQLKLLEGFDLKGMGHNTCAYIHTVTECAKLAFADRDQYYGDPLFTEVPFDRLLSAEYASEQRKKIDINLANNKALWDFWKEEQEEGSAEDTTYNGDTTHLDVIDSEGFMMSATPSGGWIPSSPVVPELGFPLGTRAQVFFLQEGHPNCLQPGKRPRATLTPSLAFKDGRPWMVFGTPGGDMQDQWTLQFFLNVAEFNMDLSQAVQEPSFHTTHFINSFYPHNMGDGTVFVEEGISMDVLYGLQEKGHRIHLNPPNFHGEVCAVVTDPETGFIQGAASPKFEGNAYAMGW